MTLPAIFAAALLVFGTAASTHAQSPAPSPADATTASLAGNSQWELQHETFSAAGLQVFRTSTPNEYLIGAPLDIRSVGFWWQGELIDAEVQLIDVDGGQSPLYPIVEDHDLGPDHAGAVGLAADRKVSSLTHHYDAASFAVRLTLPDVSALEELNVIWVPWQDSTIQQPSPKSSGSARGYPKPSVYSRSSWSADPPQCNSSYCSVTHIALHHTAGASEYNSPNWSTSASNVKSIQSYHMYTRGWCDIGYNYLIDVHGYIFEGRGGGADIRGAHDGYNCGSMGVAMMGYFHTPHNQTLTTSMKNAFCELGAWKCDQKNINPLGSAWYSGYGGSMTTIYGHRNVSSTACPGDLAYAQLPSLRQDIDDKINGGSGGTEIILDNNQAIFQSGNWSTGTSSGDKYGSDYRWASTNTAYALAYWRPNIPSAGTYKIYYWWPQGGNRNPNTKIGWQVNGNTTTSNVNQQNNGGQWNLVTTKWLPKGTKTLIGLDNSGSGTYVVIADAIRLVKQ